MGSMKRAEVEEEEGYREEEESRGRTGCSRKLWWLIDGLPGPWVDAAPEWPAIVSAMTCCWRRYSSICWGYCC